MYRTDRTKICRVVDANFNRAAEGLRVCEDICRFLLNQRTWTSEYKKMRHQLSGYLKAYGAKNVSLIKERNIERDVGKPSISTELRRNNSQDIFFANSQRVKESIRVLEEFAKLSDRRLAEGLKRLRYKAYALEKKVNSKY